MQNKAIDLAINSGLDYLSRQQLRNGGFASSSSRSLEPFVKEKTYQTNFVPALILGAISGIGGPTAARVRERLAKYLLGQIGEAGSFNYWSRADNNYSAQPYPDDLDDTFCALSALCLNDPKAIDEPMLTKTIGLLLGTETKVGGPYRTWLVPADSDKAWRDVDLAVNSNVGYFLSLVSKPLPNLVDFIDQAIVKRRLSSPYYPSPHAVVYYAARGYSGYHRKELSEFAQSLKTSTPLELALIASSLQRLGSDDQGQNIQKLLGLQTSDGSWPESAFCLDPAINGQPYYNGAATLTTALAIEALGLYQRLPDDNHQAPVTKAAPTKHRALAMAKSRDRKLPQPLKASLSKALEEIAASSNGTEIIGLPASFNESLLKPLKRTPQYFDLLALANLYGWLAYTVYDDFYDGAGTPSLLPAANTALRRSWDGFLSAAPKNESSRRLIDSTFSTIDNANSWELKNCRFAATRGHILVKALPGYGKLEKVAEKSIGHTLSPLIILLASGHNPEKAAFKHTSRALYHYLIVRQLNDDVHDWQTDLEHGHISYVVARLLAELKIRPGSHELSGLTKRAQRQFWHHTLTKLCAEMRGHVHISRRELAASRLFVEENVLSQLLDRLEAAIDEALESQQQAVSFLRHYNKQSVD